MPRRSLWRALVAGAVVVSMLVTGCAAGPVIGRILLQIGMQIAVTEGANYIEKWLHDDPPTVPTVTISFTNAEAVPSTVTYAVQKIRDITVKGLQGNVSITGSTCAWSITVAPGTLAEVEIKGEEGESIHCYGAVPQPSSADQGPRTTSFEIHIPPSGVTELDVSVATGTIQAFTSGPICVLDVCLEGNGDARRGSVVILLPRSAAYHLYGLVPTFNSRTTYSGRSDFWPQVANERVNSMFGQRSCGDQSCNKVYLLVVGPQGIVTHESRMNPSP